MNLLGRVFSRKVLWIVLWTLHVLLLVAIVCGLWALGRYYRVDSALLSPLPRLHGIWLPLLFVLLYAAGWLAWWFVRLLTDPADGEFPDVLDAWNEGLQALNAAGIDPSAVPVFLVVGKPASGPADFFAATEMPFAVRGEPRRSDAPVRIYADREAIYVVAERASAVSRLAEVLTIQILRADAMTKSSLPPKPQPDAESLLDVLYAEPEIAGSCVDLFASDKPTLNATDWLPKPGAAAIAELVWAVITSNEFRFNH